jgi:hypothetical protein
MDGIPAHAPNPTDLLVAWGRGETDAFERTSHRRIGRERPGLTARGSQKPRGTTA